jgi:type I restriction enzyme M protein
VNAKARDIVQKLWNASKSLQGGGVSYLDYVSELTFLLFLKMLEERKREDNVPLSCRWSTLKHLDGMELLTAYRRALLDLSDPKTAGSGSPLIAQIYADAKTSITQPASLRSLFNVIDQVDWFTLDEDGIGDLYEGLLERTVGERKSKAGQYFTPRALIECMVRLTKPEPGKTIQDPAAGTGGFLIGAHAYIRKATDDLFALPSERAFFQRRNAYVGMELIGSTRRLGIMNMMLHGIEAVLTDGDTLGPDGEALGKADLVLTNPPFNKFPERVARADFVITANSAKGPLPFVEHVVRALKPGGRAAIVVPDNVLFEDNTGRKLRGWLMELANLHTILRLPTGIFYAQGVKTNVLFLTRGQTDRANTKAVWVYDLRANMPAFGKTRPLTVADFAEFEMAYGDEPNGGAARTETGPEGRWRRFTREEITARNDNLDIAWLRDDSDAAEDDLSDPEDILAAILGHLRAALTEVEAVDTELAVEEVAPVGVAT